MKKRIPITLCWVIFNLVAIAQPEKQQNTHTVVRVNFINPGVEYEFPIYKKIY